MVIYHLDAPHIVKKGCSTLMRIRRTAMKAKEHIPLVITAVLVLLYVSLVCSIYGEFLQMLASER